MSEMRLNQAKALFLAAIDDQEQGRFVEAEEKLRQAHALLPERESILNNLSAVLRAQNKFAEALALAEQVLQRQPAAAEALLNAALCAESLQRLPLATDYFRRLLTLQGEHCEGLLGAARCALYAQAHQEAVQWAERACVLRPDLPEAFYLKALACQGTRQFRAALQACLQVLALDPAHVEACRHAADAAFECEEIEQAIELYQRALALSPDHHETLHNLGNALANIGSLHAARDNYDQALLLQPEAGLSRLNRSLVDLALGNFQRGFADYEARGAVLALPVVAGQPWRGEDLRGQRLFVHAEQGFGDMLLFVRFVHHLLPQLAQLQLGVPEAMGRLLRASLPASVSIVTNKRSVLPYDFHCSLASLPYRLNLSDAAQLGSVAYLQAPSDLRAHWQQRLAGLRAPRIGLVWHGSVGSAAGGHFARRALPLRAFEHLKDYPASFISLQTTCSAPDRESWQDMPWLLDLSTEIKDFADTAAIIEALDLVISVDTAVPALAAALGRPVWVLLAQPADWRWMAEGERTPWFPHARLMRQARHGDWPSVLEAQLWPALQAWIRSR